jgi:adenine-specific DNA-methyltransferase
VKLEPLRGSLNAVLKKAWQEWEIPREVEANWPEEAKKLHANWWAARIACQKEIDASIAAKAEFEYLYDKPYEDKKKVRVAGPFTVESLSPHRVLGVDENDELIDTAKEEGPEYGAKQSFPQMILENLKTAGVQQAPFSVQTSWPPRAKPAMLGSMCSSLARSTTKRTQRNSASWAASRCSRRA